MRRLNVPKLLLSIFNLSLVIGVAVGTYTHADFIKSIREKSGNTNVQPSDEYSLQMENAALMGIQRCLKCLNIAIVGAGVAGLTAGVELSLAGHNVTIFEASNRTGGRILTYRHPTGGYMTELGAMRLPLDVHTLLKTYINERFKLPIVDFINEDLHTLIYINNVHATTSDANANPNMFGFKVNPDELNKTPDDLWNAAVEPLLNYLEQEGMQEFAKKYAAFSVDQYLNSINMSRAAIDYIGLMFGIETNLHLSITESIYDMKIHRGNTHFYHIKDGNDRLTDSLRDRCLAIPDQRCSITYNTKVTNVTYHNNDTPRNVQLTLLNSSSEAIQSPKYDKTIIATTASAANMIEFVDPSLFVDKYRALRQVHYDCASKVALFFKQKWWYNSYAINGGRSTTDLSVRAAYFHNFNVSLTDGAAILGSYTWGQDSIVWQSLSEATAIQLALNNINRIYAKEHVYQSFDGGKVKHWCDDEYSHGAFTLFTPFQERDIKEALQKSINDDIHFIGEHTSSAHGWIEGAILSALRAVMVIQEESFDVVIVGGGPIGLLTAISLASKRPNVTIAIVEQYQISNTQGSSHENVRQFRQPHSEVYLAELAKISIPMWRKLEQDANLTAGSILNLTSGFLIIGDPAINLTTVEGNYNQIRQNCIDLQMGCEFLNSTEIQNRYQFFHMQSNYNGIFHSESGYINVTQLMMVLVQIIQKNYRNNIIIREQEEFLSLDNSVPDTPQSEVRLLTSRGSMNAKKVVYVPGPYAKNVSGILGFDLQMTLWELPDLYFALRKSDIPPTPTWFAVGNNVQSHFHSYPGESSEKPGFIKISPEFIKDMDQPLIYPKDRQGPTENLVQYFIAQAQQWIYANAPLIDPANYTKGSQTCLATFVPDNGFIIDYLPTNVNYRSKSMMYASGWGMKFAPVFAEILVDLILDTIEISNYTKYMPQFSFNIKNRVTPSSSTTSPISTTSATKTPLSPGTTTAIILGCALFAAIIVTIVLSAKLIGARRQREPVSERTPIVQVQ